MARPPSKRRGMPSALAASIMRFASCAISAIMPAVSLILYCLRDVETQLFLCRCRGKNAAAPFLFMKRLYTKKRESVSSFNQRSEFRPRKHLLAHTRIGALFAQFVSNAPQTRQYSPHRPGTKAHACHAELGKFWYRRTRGSGQDIDRAIDRLYQACDCARIAHSNREKAVRPSLPVLVRALYSLLEATMRISYLRQENIGPRIHHQGYIQR